MDVGSRIIGPIKRRLMLRLTLRPAPPVRGDVSQNGEYSYLHWLLPRDWPRFLVDVGANDGMTFSNTWNLLEDGYSGVLVEPHPDTFTRLRLNTRAHNVELFNFAVGAGAGEVELYEDRATDGKNLMATIRQEHNAWFDRVRSAECHTVRMERLDTLLAKTDCPPDFSLLSVDTEGHDRAVLESLGEYEPRVIVTERSLWDPEEANGKHLLLASRGYVYVHRLGCNELFAHKRWLGQLEHAY
jgi:FkbM family methyltransferase